MKTRLEVIIKSIIFKVEEGLTICERLLGVLIDARLLENLRMQPGFVPNKRFPRKR